MTSEMQTELCDLYFELSQLKCGQDQGVVPCDGFIRNSFRIASILVNDDRLVRLLSKELLLIPKAQSDHKTNLSLGDSFAAVEQDLEENLRGFSSLLNWVLEDTVIRQDPELLLDQIPSIPKSVREKLVLLVDNINAYFDLEDVFGVDAPRVLAILFLASVCELYDAIDPTTQCRGTEMVSLWLKERIRNADTMRLFRIASAMPDLISLSERGDEAANEIWLFAICKRLAEGTPVNASEAPHLDRILKKLGMLGLTAVVESGALQLEIEHHQEACVEKTVPRIFRIK